MATPVIFNFFDYLKNPIADFCVSNYKSKMIYTIDDLLPEIQKLNHSRWALGKGCKSYIGDQLRLKLATENDDFFYADADVFIPNLSDITKHKNCTDFIPEQNIINNGTFFTLIKIASLIHTILMFIIIYRKKTTTYVITVYSRNTRLN